MPQKQNNNRKYPNATRQPCHTAAERAGRGEARQEAYEALTTQQKLDLHNRVAPPPQGEKQRRKLLAELNNPQAKVVRPKIVRDEPALIQQQQEMGITMEAEAPMLHDVEEPLEEAPTKTTHPWSEIKSKMSPESQAAIKHRAQEMLAAMDATSELEEAPSTPIKAKDRRAKERKGL